MFMVVVLEPTALEMARTEEVRPLCYYAHSEPASNTFEEKFGIFRKSAFFWL
jgi:hypothetical protein